nr:hypothetical protein [Tanacetum cinerariifolium]
SNDVTEEEYERINEELYGDVNVSLTVDEHANKDKDDEEMTVAGHVNINQEDACNQVKDAAQETQKTEVPIPTEIVERLRHQYAPQKSIEDIQEIKIEHARKLQVPKETITSSNTTALEEFDQKTTLFETMTKSKSFNKSPKQRALYHALMESILEDEDAMDEGVADKLKKRKPNDTDKDEGPFARSYRGLKRQKTSKDTKTSKKAKSTESSKGTSTSQPKSTGKSTQAEETVFEAGDTQGPYNLGEDTCNTDEAPVVNVDPKDWFKKPKRSPTPDHEWNIGPAYNILKGTCRSYIELDYNMEECYKALTDQLDWNNPEGDRYPFDLCKPLALVMPGNRQIISVDYFFNNDLAFLQGGSTDITYTTSLAKTKAAKYDLPGIKDMVPNLWCPVKVAYDKHALLGNSHWVTNVKVKEWYGYGHLEEIEV